MKKFIAFTLFITTVLLFSQSTFAGIEILKTRFVYNEGSKGLTIKVSNNNQIPYIVQSWVDLGKENSTPNDSVKDFFVQPPIAKVPANSGLDVKVIYSGSNQNISNEKESLFYINVAQIPPNSDTNGQNIVNFIIRHKMKLFFRPASLKGKTFSTDQISFYINNGKVFTKNNSPFYVTFESIIANNGIVFKSDMVSPNSTKELKLEKGKNNNISNINSVNYNYVNDIGKFIPGSYKIK